MWLNEITNLILKWAVPVVCAALLTYIAQDVKNRKAERDGLQSLLRQEIIRSYEKYSERGYCPIYAKEALKREYKSYHALGGNDVATDLYKKCLKLPTEPPKEECK